MELFAEIFDALPRQGPGKASYTRRAFAATDLATRPAPRVLDIGCGSGASTLALAQACPLSIVAVDRSPALLERLRQAATCLPLLGTIEIRCQAMQSLDVPLHAFDAVWSEGAIYLMGFAQGLAAWRRYVKPGGYVVVSDMTWIVEAPPPDAARFWVREYPAMTTVAANLQTIADLGYTCVEHFVIGPDGFWDDYYTPLAERLAELRTKYAMNPEAQAMIADQGLEIEMYQRDWTSYSYVFYVCLTPRPAG